MESRVVAPESCRLAISNGDWLHVKKRLNAGENRRMIKRGNPQFDGVHLDLIEGGLAKILAYLLDWSVTDQAGHALVILGQPPDVVEAALDAIDPESYTEVLRAIEAHEVAMAEERTAQKKIRPGETTSSPPSPSPGTAATPTSGSSS